MSNENVLRVAKHKKIPRVVSAVKRMEFYSTHIIQEGFAPTLTTKTDNLSHLTALSFWIPTSGDIHSGSIYAL